MLSSKLEDELARVLALALRYVRAGVRSGHEVRTYLRRRGVAAETASRAVTALSTTRGVLDDRACARLWADQWARRGYASTAIRVKLSAKGLDDVTIDHAITQLQISSDDDARAREVVARYARSDVGRQGRARMARTLASRGFDSDLIEQVLNESFGPLVSS